MQMQHTTAIGIYVSLNLIHSYGNILHKIF